jgi:hypothetical protein
MINHKKGERKTRERDYHPEEVAAECRNKSISPTRKFWAKVKGINTPLSSIQSEWMTLKRLRKEKDIS